MRKAIASSLLISAIVAGGCRPSVVGSDIERSAPPDQFVVTTKAGTRLTGPAARIDIRHVGPAGTDVECSFGVATAISAANRVVRSCLGIRLTLPDMTLQALRLDVTDVVLVDDVGGVARRALR